MNGSRPSGFTLIELLVVIAIIAILAIVVILTLNPAQLILQARDSNRISDLATIKSAVGYYLQDTSAPSMGSSGVCYEGLAVRSANGTATSSCPWFVTASTTVNNSSSRATVGGWIPVNIAGVSYGSPLGSWPVDPLNTTSYFYSYAAGTTNNSFKVAATMESSKFGYNGTSDVVSRDGGSSTSTYEQGTNLQL